MIVTFAFIDEPPFVSPSGKHWPEGCDAAVAAAVLERMGIRSVEARLVTFAELIPGIAARRWSINTPLFMTPDRATQVRFSRPVWALPDGLMTLKGNAASAETYEAVAADPDARLGVVDGQIQALTARSAGIPDERIIRFSSPEAVFAALLNGEVSAYASVAMAHRGYLERTADERVCFSNLGLAEHKGKAGSIPAYGAFSFALDDASFANDFDAALGSFLGTDAHAEIMAQFGFSVRDGIAWG
jgi:polar amino acid transport system substrate-binding protein